MIGRVAHVAISGYILYINVICRGPGKSAVSGDELKISRLYLHLDYPSALLIVYTGISCRTPLRIRYSALLLCTLISCGTPSLVTRTGANPVWVVYAWHSTGVSCRQPAADIRVRCHLRSADTTTLLVPPTRQVTLGDRAFPVAAARAWNSLPAQIRAASSLLSFRWQTLPICFSCRTTDF